MEGLLRKWRSARLCAIWALLLRGLPRDVVRVHVMWRLNWQPAYCWACLRGIPVHLPSFTTCLYREDDDKQPVCSAECQRVRWEDRNYMDYYDVPHPLHLLAAYDWLVALARRRDQNPAGDFHDTTIAQSLVQDLIYQRWLFERKSRRRAYHHMRRGVRERGARDRDRWKRKQWREIQVLANEGSF